MAKARRQRPRKCSTLGLAAAMERGAKKRGQARGYLFEQIGLDGEKPTLGGSCALGAAYEGAFGTPPIRFHRNGFYMVDGGVSKMHRALWKRFPALCRPVSGPYNERHLEGVVMSLNDDKGWSRAKIARWLRKLKAV